MNKWCLRCLLTFLSISSFICPSDGQHMDFTDTVYSDVDGKAIESIIKYRVTGHDTVKNGPAIYFYQDGSLWQKGFYLDGQFDSLWTVYHANGQVSSEINFSAGIKSNNFTYYHENGIVKTRGTYDNDSLTGLMTLYFDS